MKRYATFLVVLLLIAWALENSWGLITGSIGTLFVERKIPSSYIKLENLLQDDKAFSRVLYIPTRVRWGYSNVLHPIVSYVELENGFKWKAAIDSCFGPPGRDIFAQVPAPGQVKCFSNLLDKAAIKYIVVPLQDTENDDDVYAHYHAGEEEGPDSYIKWLRNMRLGDELDLGLGMFVLKLRNFTPNLRLESPSGNTHYSLRDVEPLQPWGFRFKIDQADPNDILYFAERFNKNISMNIVWGDGSNWSTSASIDPNTGFVVFHLPDFVNTCNDNSRKICGNAQIYFEGNNWLGVGYKFSLAVLFIVALYAAFV